MKRVAVLGGGVSGLAAACWLRAAEPAIEVALYEQSERVGGVLETLRVGDYLIEKGADNFATLVPDALALSRQCGLESELIQPCQENRRAFVLHRGRLLPIPAGFSLMQPTRIGSILSTGTLSWRGKLRLLTEYFVRRREAVDDESLESFVTRRLGREAFENLVEPIVSGIFTADPSTLSMQATMPQFMEMERAHGGLIRGYLASRRQDAAAAARRASGARYDQFMAPKAGMSAWVSAIAGSLPHNTIHLNSPVSSLRTTSDENVKRWELTTPKGTERFDGVICSLPAAATAKLLEHDLRQAAQLVGAIPYASSVVVAMVVNRRDLQRRIDGFGMISPSKEGRSALAISYTSNKYPGRTPDNEILLRVFMGGALRPRMHEQRDEQLEQLAATEVRSILGWQGTQPNWQRVVRWPNAMPQYLVGHVDRMQQLDGLLEPHPTLQLCGAAYHGVGIPQCIRGARKAAEALTAVLDDVASRPS